MNIDVELLEKCSVLTDYEKDLIRRIDGHHETQVRVARHYEKSPGTISIQHKKALEKFTAWLKKRGESEKALPQQDFDKQVFKMLNKGIGPAEIVAKVGRAREVAKLAELWEQLNSHDYWQTIGLLRENDMFYRGYAIEKPLLYSANKIVQNYYALKNQVEGLEEAVKILKKVNSRKDKRIETLETLKEIFRIENEELSGLKVYADLTDEQIQQRRETILELDGGIKGLKNLHSQLKLQVDREKYIIFDLKTKIREGVKEYLSGLDNKEIWQLVIEAKWGKTNPLIAKVLTSQS